MNFSVLRLVVFGAGYVGAEVARQGLARGLRVTALTRNPDRARELAAAGIETIVADLAENHWHTQITGGADFVLNSVSAGGGGVAGYQRSYVAGMRSILDWAAQNTGPIGTLVYTSSTAVYPQGDGAIVDETSPISAGSPTAEALIATENLLLNRASSSVPSPPAIHRAFILRLAGIYGPVRHHLLDQLRAGATELSGRGDHHLNLTHRDDIASAIWAAFTAPEAQPSDIFNVADNAAATKAEVVAWLASHLGVPAPCFTSEPAVGRRALIPDRLIANGKIHHILGWRPKYPTFHEGYAAILASGPTG